ncbi:CHAD domain-containing protein [Paenibacillus albidus]|uniref:CHAD domain-containing protein n=1 Tax=Paenibacillus albidus TaxID=2041023 RepID=UPI001BE86FEF|nr:CHAD domain-containing protein [Paenibacillus albidus]MBT2293071.1 CHAD domain-containing protein [Paenibacillus albidus]
MTAEQPSTDKQFHRTRQWELALGQLYKDFQDYSAQAAHQFKAKDIHQARVNSRKLLTLLSILDPGHVSDLYPVFKKAQKRLGKVRDADVLIDSFQSRRKQAKADGDPKTAKLLKSVVKYKKHQRKKYRQKLQDELPKLTGKKLETKWNHFIGEQLGAFVANKDANVVMRELEVAYEQKKKICKALFREQEAATEEAFDSLHQLRIAAKELRYTASAASFALHSKFHAHEEIYKEIQDQLGLINDKRVWLETLHAIGPKELDVGTKTWNAFMATLRAEVLEALQQNDVIHIAAKP